METSSDLLALMNAQQKQQFTEAMGAVNAKRFAEALVTLKLLLSQIPHDAVLSKYASETSLNAGDAAYAFTTLTPLVQADPDDWQASGILVRACAETGNAPCRDSGMNHMIALYRRGVTPPGMRQYTLEQVKVGTNVLLISASLEPYGPYKVYFTGKVSNADSKLMVTATLESGDGDQPTFAKQHPKEAAEGMRLFSLDAYRETGLNSQGQRTQTHETYLFFMGQPPYAAVRDEFVKIAAGKASAVSSRSGLIVP